MKQIASFAAALIAALGLGLASAENAQATDPLKVVVTIKPIHSLTSAIMKGAGKPTLLIKGAGSPHSYALRPSEARTLNSADIIVRVSENLEIFLEKPIESLSKTSKIVTLSRSPGVKLLDVRESGAFEAHDHAHGDEHEHDHEAKAAENDHHDEGYDAHLWLSPANAAAIADHLVSVFAEARPENAKLYKANAETLKQRIAALDANLKTKVAPLKGKPFIVFHDAYQYFEDHFGLHAAGAITISPERQPGAARLRQIRAKISETHVACVFSEPQFEPKLMRTIIEGTNAKAGVLDPLGAALAQGADQYFELLTNLAQGLNDCLHGPA